MKEFNKVITHIQGNVFPGKTAFRLFDTFGFPIEITTELASEKGFTVDVKGYEDAYKLHQEKSHQCAIFLAHPQILLYLCELKL